MVEGAGQGAGQGKGGWVNSEGASHTGSLLAVVLTSRLDRRETSMYTPNYLKPLRNSRHILRNLPNPC
jgi:hypothetical protein